MYSSHPKRNKNYAKFIESCGKTTLTVQDIIQLGHGIMRKAKLHPHFFADNTLLATAQYLSFFALQLPYEYTNQQYLQQPLTAPQATQICCLFERRIAERVPVEYLSNEAWYLNNKFYVNQNVLVPRSIMSTRFSDFLNQVKWQNYRVLDLCTGSGCIGISLALMNTKITVDLVDISTAALAVAKINVDNYNLGNRVTCIQSDLFANLQDKYDLIISNPPYVSTADYKKIPAEFKREPQLALEADNKGLAIIDQILMQAKSHLNPQGQLIMEVGYASAKLVKKRYKKLDLEWFNYRRPVAQATWFSRWIEPLVAMDGTFKCAAAALS
jgi:ribosomal protein L3 glutamine methyltransferase